MDSQPSEKRDRRAYLDHIRSVGLIAERSLTSYHDLLVATLGSNDPFCKQAQRILRKFKNLEARLDAREDQGQAISRIEETSEGKR